MVNYCTILHILECSANLTCAHSPTRSFPYRVLLLAGVPFMSYLISLDVTDLCHDKQGTTDWERKKCASSGGAEKIVTWRWPHMRLPLHVARLNEHAPVADEPAVYTLLELLLKYFNLACMTSG